MRALTPWLMVGLLLAIAGLIGWGVIDGQQAARTWKTCSSDKHPAAGPDRIGACGRAIATGRVGSGSLIQAYAQRSDLYLDAHDYTRAIADADEAVSLRADSQFALNLACWARAVGGVDLDKARERCDRAIALSQDDGPNPQVLDSRGLVDLKQGRFEAARTDYDAAVKAQPKDGHYLYGRAIAELRLGDDEAGRADIAAAMKQDAKIAATYKDYGITP